MMIMVRTERLELSRVAPLEPKSSAYTNFATSALLCAFIQQITRKALRGSDSYSKSKGSMEKTTFKLTIQPPKKGGGFSHTFHI